MGKRAGIEASELTIAWMFVEAAINISAAWRHVPAEDVGKIFTASTADDRLTPA